MSNLSTPSTTRFPQTWCADMESGSRVPRVREPKTTVAAEVPVVGGKGTILFSGLYVQGHVDRSKPHYDPVAEKILINMLQGTEK